MAFFPFRVLRMWSGRSSQTRPQKRPRLWKKRLGCPWSARCPSLSDVRLRLALGSEGMRLAGNRWRGLQDGFFDEGIRHLRGYLMLSVQASPPRSVLFTSALPGEGKSTLALSLAMVNAEHGKRTLLIDADLRQPAIERLAHLDPDAGLAEVLRTEAHWRTAVRPVSAVPNLFVLGSGLPLPLALPQIGPQMRGILAQAIQGVRSGGSGFTRPCWVARRLWNWPRRRK